MYAFVYSSTFYVNRLKSVILGEDPAVDDVVEFDEGVLNMNLKMIVLLSRSSSQGKSKPIWWGFDSQVDDDEVGWVGEKQDDLLT